MWCPSCKSEYRDAFKRCEECNVSLVKHLELNEGDDEQNGDEWVLLVNVADGFECDLIEGLLRAHGISILREYEGLGQYTKIYTGMSIQGVNLLVPSSELEKAKEILKSKPEKLTDEEIEAFENDELEERE